MREETRQQILIVDDEFEITDLLSFALGKVRDCVTAGSAEEALDRLKEGHFDLVISDISMPGMSGLEMIPLVKKISANIISFHRNSNLVPIDRFFNRAASRLLIAKRIPTNIVPRN